MNVLKLIEQAVGAADPVEELASAFVMEGWVVLKDSPLAVYLPDENKVARVGIQDGFVVIGDKRVPYNPEEERTLEAIVDLARDSAEPLPKKEPAKTTAILSLVMTGDLPHGGDTFKYEDLLISFDGELARASSPYGYTLTSEYPKEGDKITRAMTMAYDLFSKIEKARKIEPLYAELERRRLEHVRKRIRELAREAGIKISKVDDWTLDLEGRLVDLRVIKEMEDQDRAIVSSGISRGRSRSEILDDLRRAWDKIAEDMFSKSVGR